MRNEHKYFLLAAIFIGIFATLSYIVVNTKVEIGPLKDKGIALLNSGKYNESIVYFDKALTINPKDAAEAEEAVTIAAEAEVADISTPPVHHHFLFQELFELHQLEKILKILHS